MNYVGKPVVLVLATAQKVVCLVERHPDNSGVRFRYPCEYGINQQGQEVVVPYHPYSGLEAVCEMSDDFIKGIVEVTHDGTLAQWKKLTKQTVIETPNSNIVIPAA